MHYIKSYFYQPDNILYAPSSINMASVCYEHFYSAAYTYYIFIFYAYKVYNETIRDLLMPGQPLAVREDPQRGVCVSGLTLHKVLFISNKHWVMYDDRYYSS